jgi:hypothetical protein
VYLSQPAYPSVVVVVVTVVATTVVVVVVAVEVLVVVVVVVVVEISACAVVVAGSPYTSVHVPHEKGQCFHVSLPSVLDVVKGPRACKDHLTSILPKQNPRPNVRRRHPKVVLLDQTYASMNPAIVRSNSTFECKSVSKNE